LGESICINGTCLTMVAIGEAELSFDVSAESLRRTNLGDLQPGNQVNLERSLRVNDRLSGHLVFGHVDGVGRVKAIQPDGDSFLYTFEIPPDLSRYLVEKGSVAVDGISLTVFHCQPTEFTCAIIPHPSGDDLACENPRRSREPRMRYAGQIYREIRAKSGRRVSLRTAARTARTNRCATAADGK